jgi:hypothetical protein
VTPMFKGALHPNGFVIRLLHVFRNGARLRLHTWPAGESMLVHRCHATTSGNGKPQTTFECMGGVTEVASVVRRALVPYVCPAGTIHSFVPRSRYAASIVLFGPPRRTPRVWVSSNG